MATTDNGLKNNGQGVSLLALVEQLRAMGVAIPEQSGLAESKPATTPALPTVSPAPASEPKKRTRKVQATASNGAKVDLTDPYRRMVEFTHKAIRTLRAVDGKSKGIHSVYSGFNLAFGKHFGLAKEQVWQTVDLMTERGDIQSRFGKGGKMLYLPGEMSDVQRANADDVLAKILAAK